MENVLLWTTAAKSPSHCPEEAGTFACSGKGLRLRALKLPGVGTLVCDPSTREAEVEKLGVQRPSGLALASEHQKEPWLYPQQEAKRRLEGLCYENMDRDQIWG